MINRFIIALLLVLWGAPALWAQGAGTTVDPRTGNTYRWMQNPDGSTYLQGTNPYTGSQWNSNIQPNGNSQGRDSRGNPWNYNSDTNVYRNSDGTVCTGEGAARRCF
jgi:hypothetical protein